MFQSDLLGMMTNGMADFAKTLKETFTAQGTIHCSRRGFSAESS
jgi:hypothetical protein